MCCVQSHPYWPYLDSFCPLSSDRRPAAPTLPPPLPDVGPLQAGVAVGVLLVSSESRRNSTPAQPPTRALPGAIDDSLLVKRLSRTAPSASSIRRHRGPKVHHLLASQSQAPSALPDSPKCASIDSDVSLHQTSPQIAISVVDLLSRSVLQ